MEKGIACITSMAYQVSAQAAKYSQSHSGGNFEVSDSSKRRTKNGWR